MILGLSSADGGMTVGLWKLSSLDSRRPPWLPRVTYITHRSADIFLKGGIDHINHGGDGSSGGGDDDDDDENDDGKERQEEMIMMMKIYDNFC